MAKSPETIYECKNLTVQDLINFCQDHDLPLTTEINLASGITELFLEPFTELAIIEKQIILYSY